MSRLGADVSRLVARPVGAVVAGLGIVMALCAIVGVALPLFDAEPHPLDRGASLALSLAALLTGLSGAALMWYGWSARPIHMTRRDAVAVVALIWFGSSFFGALPFVFDARFTPVDGFFEAVSGFTTTGATIVGDIEGSLSRPLLLWRSVTQWLGGMGIVVLFVAVFPSLGVGAKHMFRSEVPGPTAEGLQPRIAETSLILWLLYAGFTVVQTLALWALGMSLYEAVCHAFTTMSTGGFSTRDASIASFDSPSIELVIALFMLLAGVNFGLYYNMLRRRSIWVFLRSVEFRVYLGIVLVASTAITIAILPVHGDLVLAARYAVFQVATFVTSTGYTTDAYMVYPSPGLAVILLLMFVGASAGSTAGGIKVARVVLLAKMSLGQVRRSVRPTVVHVVRLGRSAVEDSVLFDVAVFLVVFIASLGIGTLLLTLTDGVSPQTAFGAVLSCLSNMGPAPFHVDVDNYARYSDAAKIILSVAMVLGRLEFFTLLALLLPDFWRR